MAEASFIRALHWLSIDHIIVISPSGKSLASPLEDGWSYDASNMVRDSDHNLPVHIDE